MNLDINGTFGATNSVARKRHWQMTDGADFLNSLCPVSYPEFPSFDWLPHQHQEALQRACTVAFNALEKQITLLRLEQMGLKEYERRVLWAIDRKTIGFRKLLEKLPTRVFLQGQLTDEGTSLALDNYGLPILPVVMKDRRNTDRMLRDLVAKGIISKLLSDEGQFSAANIYSPAPLSFLIEEFTVGLHALSNPTLDKYVALLRSEIISRCSPMIEATRRSAQHASDVRSSLPCEDEMITVVSDTAPTRSVCTDGGLSVRIDGPPPVSANGTNTEQQYQSSRHDPPAGTGSLRDPERGLPPFPKIRKRTRPAPSPR